MRSLFHNPPGQAHRCSNCQQDRFSLTEVEGQWLCRPCNRGAPQPVVSVSVTARRTGKSLMSGRMLRAFQVRFERWRRRNRYLVVVVAEGQRLRKQWEVSRMRPSRAKHLQKLERYARRVKAVRGIQ